jgi:ATP-dependent RNA helicase DOB1
MQGRAACEIDTADELVVSEMMVNGAFKSLDKHQIAALASCMVAVEKSQVGRCVK